MLAPIGCPKTSLTNYKSTLHNIPEKPGPNLCRGESLTSRKIRKLRFVSEFTVPKWLL